MKRFLLKQQKIGDARSGAKPMLACWSLLNLRTKHEGKEKKYLCLGILVLFLVRGGALTSSKGLAPVADAIPKSM